MNAVAEKNYQSEMELTGQLATSVEGYITRLFGCWHTEMSRPFTHEGESYRACLNCGAHRLFDTQSWEMRGPYYYSQARVSRRVRRIRARLDARPSLMRAQAS
ncbi:MAG TPA: hypothetical protein VF723_08115 [Pyrinomonadaceae bacterium]|jgi:hypothetical protein